MNTPFPPESREGGAPDAGRGVARGVFGALGAPLAWSVQIASSVPLAAMACGSPAPRIAPGLQSHAGLVLVVVSAACLLAASASAWLACADWRAARRHPRAAPPADREAAVAPGNRSVPAGARPGPAGRREFLAALGAMASVLFLAGVVFTAISLALVSSCAA
jgi:hypothetical protein